VVGRIQPNCSELISGIRIRQSIAIVSPAPALFQQCASDAHRRLHVSARMDHEIRVLRLDSTSFEHPREVARRCQAAGDEHVIEQLRRQLGRDALEQLSMVDLLHGARTFRSRRRRISSPACVWSRSSSRSSKVSTGSAHGSRSVADLSNSDDLRRIT
jgi:hypothetical protein